MFPVLSIYSLLAILLLLHLIGKNFGKRVFHVTLASVVLKLMVGLLNKIAGPLPGADVDAVAFETIAQTLAQTWSWSEIHFLAFTHRYAYSNVLALIFYVDGYNIALVPLFNTALTTFAAYNVYQAARLLNVDRKNIYLIALILAFNPIIILYSAVPMREAPIYALIALFFRILFSLPRRPTVLLRPTLLLTIVVGSYMHIGLAALALVLVAYAFNFSFSLKAVARPRNLLTVVVLAVVVNVALSTAIVKSLPRVTKLLDSDTGSLSFSSLESAQEAKSRGEGAYVYLSPDSGIPIVDIAVSSAYMTARLIFSPFPWEISSASVATLIKIIDLMCEIGLNFLAIRNIRQRNGADKTVFLYASYLFMCLVFGLNTVNDGVALRHRTKFIWILVLVAFSPHVRRRQPAIAGRMNA